MTLVDRQVRVVVGGRIVAEGQAVADGTPGVLVREAGGKQIWWPSEFVELNEIGTRVPATA
jgi:hypothetical protein